MSMPMNQHVAIELPLDCRQCFQITPGCYLMAVDYTYFYIADGYHFSLREIGKIVKFTSYCVHLGLC